MAMPSILDRFTQSDSLVRGNSNYSASQLQAAQLLDGIRAQRLARSSSRVSPVAQLKIMETISTGTAPDGRPLTRADVLALLASLGIVGRNLIPLRSDADPLGATVTVATAGQYIEGMGVLCIAMSTGVAVGAVPTYTRVHRATWTMDTTPMFDTQAQPFLPGPAFSSVSFFRIDRGGQTLGGSATASFPALDVGSLDTYIYEDADAAREIAGLFLGGGQ